jgi:acylphosphatase
MPYARAHLYISGRVQGVYYRGFTEELADSLGLKGWVRNLPDRRVEAVFEGEREVIEKAVRRCHEGPPASRVTDIDVTWDEKTEGFGDFRIRY